MAEVASAFVSLMPSAKGFGSKLDSEIGGDIKSSGKKHGKIFGGVMLGAAGAAIGGAVALGGFLKGAIGEARDAQKVGALTNAVIKSTGGVANVTAKDVDRLATSISLKTGIDDEAIAAGQNMLLTFGNVRNEVGKGNDIFNQATVAATDMSAAFGGDAVSNSKMLGKALNDPTKGVSALTRVGVSFTQQQKDQIKTLQASGNVIGAQKIILGELSKQTKGAAESQATAGEKFKTAFGNLQESVGTAILPLVDKIFVGLTKFVTFLTNDVGPGIAALNGYLAPAIAAVKTFFTSFSGGGAAGGLVSTLQSIATSIASNFLPVLRTAATTFTTVVLPAIGRLATYLASNLVPIFQRVGSIIATQVVPIIASLARFFYGTLYPAVVKIVTVIASNLKPVFDQLFRTIQGSVLPTIQKLLAKFREWQPTIQAVILVVVKVIGKVLEFAAAILGKVLPPLIRFAGFLIGAVVGAITTVIGVAVKIVAALIKVGGAVGDAIGWFVKFSNKVDSAVREALGYVAAIPGKIKGYFSGAGKLLLGVGGQIVQGLVNGITTAAHKVYDAAMALVDKIPGPIKKVMGIHSPSKVMHEIGGHIGQGLVNGLKAKDSALKKQVQSMTDTVQSMRDKLKGLKDEAAGFSDSVAGAFKGQLFNTTVEVTDASGGTSSAAGGLAGLQKQLFADTQNANAFYKAFNTAQKKGLDGGLAKELAASGDTKTAQDIAALSKTQIAQLEAQYATLQNLTAGIGDDAAKQQYGQQMAAQNTMIQSVDKHLNAVQAHLNKVSNKLDALPDAVRQGAKDGVGDKAKETTQRRKVKR